MKTPYREKTTIGSLGISQVKNPNLKVTKDYKNGEGLFEYLGSKMGLHFFEDQSGHNEGLFLKKA